MEVDRVKRVLFKYCEISELLWARYKQQWQSWVAVLKLKKELNFYMNIKSWIPFYKTLSLGKFKILK